MLDCRLQEVGSLVNRVRCECKQVLFRCSTSTDLVFILGAAVVTFYMILNYFVCFDVGAVAQLQIQLELNFCLLFSFRPMGVLEVGKLSESTSF